MSWMLDTNVAIQIIRERPQSVLARLALHRPGDVLISSISVAELYHGAAKSQKRAQNESALEQFLIPLEIVPFDLAAAAAYGPVRAALERDGTPIGPLDTLIAAHALSRRAVLVTNNMGEFQRVPGLVVEDWSR